MTKTATKTKGREAIEEAYNKYLRNIAEFQARNEKLKACRDGFETSILENGEITKEDIVGFINDHAFRWSLDGQSAYATWVRDAD